MADKKKLPKMSELDSPVKHHYPSYIQLDEDDFKGVRDWTVGKEYKVEVLAKLVKATQGEEYAPPGDTDAEKVHVKLEIKKILEAEPKEEEKEEREEKEPPKVVKAIKNKFLSYK